MALASSKRCGAGGRAVVCLAVVGAALTLVGAARAAVVQVPEGGRPVAVISKGVLCGPLAGGWTLESDRRSVRPPAPETESFARVLDVKVADEGATCATTQQTITLVAMGAWPDIDTTGVVFFPDDGRLELRGQRLKGTQVAWYVPAGAEAKEAREGREVCLDPQPVKEGSKQQICTIPVSPGLPADAFLYWVPPYGRSGPDVTTYDVFGSLVEPEAFRLRPSRVVLTKPLVSTTGVDISLGPGRVPLSHPSMVASADCGLARCEIADGALVVRSVPGPATSVTARLRLVPRAFIVKGDAQETSVTVTLPLLSCPMVLVPGSAVRDAEAPSLVVRMDTSCGRDPRNLRWSVQGDIAEVRRVVKAQDGVYVLLHTARFSADRITVLASRADLDGSVVASATGKTVPLPQPRASLELPAYGKIDFVPTNRPAMVRASGAGEYGRLEILPIEGAYEVVEKADVTMIEGDESAGGFVSLRFAYRLTQGLPPELQRTDLAVVEERVQRAVRDASVPAAISTSVETDAPIVELVCLDENGKPLRLPPGKPFRIPFEMRDTCRVIIHRERLKPEEGNQDVVLDIEVTKPDGTPRGDARLSERMVLRPGTDMRIIPVKGGLDQFDKIIVRVSQVIDESRYVLSPTQRSGVPAVQWTGIVEGGFVRLYATASIPAGLYRISEPSGQLTLNFGVLTRLVALNREGKESLLGLEFGLMGLGLIPRSGAVEFPRALGVVGGLGFRIPLGQGAAVGIQAWAAYEFREGPIKVNGMEEGDTRGWSFIFGPSIMIGNVGTNL